jgi:hypothetical protein
MKQYKRWFTVIFFAAPLAIAVILNPGRNGSNIHSFSAFALVVLAATGIAMVVYFLVNAIPTQGRRLVCTDNDATWAAVGYAWFSLVLGSTAIYEAIVGLSNLAAR